jgi:GNAT superfamily N-acetyltransferase
MLTIRDARIDDAAAMLDMLHGSAHDQGFPEEVVVSAGDLRADGFGPNPRFRAFISEVDGACAGMALFYINYSTWGSRLGLYLEDLYVRPEHRGKGVARALLGRLAAFAVAEGCGRFQWTVHRENQPAIRLYESFGAKALEDWILMSVKGSDLDALANQ